MRSGQSEQGFWKILMIAFAIFAGLTITYFVFTSQGNMDPCEFWARFTQPLNQVTANVLPDIPCPFGE
ncbi:MAG: hypothetical protein SVU88_04160 [Candidatus Nanohaloarchaea archaeon]|nr:hypothetical protein [Candidatus Nanohaloarchaea archaeon]